MSAILRYGRKIDINDIGNNVTKMVETIVHDYENKKNVTVYVQKVIVRNEKEEFAELLDFIEKTKGKKDKGFVIISPKKDTPGSSYTVEKWWTESIV